VEWTTWVSLLKQYGPIVGLFVGFIIWQTTQINKLLDRNAAIYESEVKRLADVQTMLLTHLLGPQPSSTTSPTIKQLKNGTALKPEGEKGGGT
jgi:hypothetical protein